MNRFVGQVWDALLMLGRQVVRDVGIVVAFGVIFPLGFLFFLGHIVQPGLLPQVVAGSIMMEMALFNINVVAQALGDDKRTKIYDLWVSMPIRPTVYVLSVALVWLPLSLLSAGITLGAGVAFFHISLSAADLVAIVVALILVWTSTLGIGFLIGVYGRSPRQINQLANFIGIVMTFFAPIFYPISALPLAAQYVALLWPLTWGAALLNGILSGTAQSVALAVGVLIGFSVLWLALIALGLRWRQR